MSISKARSRSPRTAEQKAKKQTKMLQRAARFAKKRSKGNWRAKQQKREFRERWRTMTSGQRYSASQAGKNSRTIEKQKQPKEPDLSLTVADNLAQKGFHLN